MFKLALTTIVASLFSATVFAQTMQTQPTPTSPPVAPSAAPDAPSKVGQGDTVPRPADAPPDATALCNDGKFSKGTSEKSACAKQQGIREWYGVPKPGARSGTKGSTP